MVNSIRKRNIMIPEPDFIFSNEKLYEHKKITFFSLGELKVLCIYFKVGDGFTVPMDLDYLEVTKDFNMNLFSSILSKEQIESEDIAKLIQLFDVFESNLTLDDALKIAQSPRYEKIDFNEMYFSVE